MSRRISLCLIVKDEEANLRGCLEGMGELADEIVVVDTGSTDRTRELARELGARVYDFKWIDDFAAARNAGQEKARGQWTLWLDADDRLDAENRQRLKGLIERLPGEPAGFLLNYRSRSSAGITVVDYLRLFANRPDIRWKYRMHEQVLPSLQRLSAKVHRTNVFIDHGGYQEPGLHRHKLERNLRLLEMDGRDRPNDIHVHFNLGWNYVALARPAEALAPLQHALRLASPGGPHLRRILGQLARAQHQLGQHGQALATCREGLARFPDYAELLFLESMLLTEVGDLPAAERCLLRLLTHGGYFIAADQQLTGSKARHSLAMIYRKQGRHGEAEALLGPDRAH